MIATAAVLFVIFRRTLNARHGWSVHGAIDLAGLLLLLASIGFYRTYPSSHDETPSQVRFQLPLDGPVTIAWGGPSAAENYHVGIPAERWAYDLLITVNGVSHRGEGTGVGDFHAYDRPVRSPSAGRVVYLRDGAPDAAPGRGDRVRAGGNLIVLDVAPGEYLFIAHLKAGTIRVSGGQRVDQGDLLGHVGNSGNSSEPHIHLHLQNDPEPGGGEAIPLYFSDYLIVGSDNAIRRGMPQGGMRHGRYVGDVVRNGDGSDY
jgi:murein DD-endopeptidase MepM/ murein hydrolase activator NlpD